jgi:KaiC/GvpD/RAD55 family RecA-like ATPase
VFTGIGSFDDQMRGISAGHLCLIVGYSHSGKTLVAHHIISNNHDKRIVYFTPDEPAPLMLTKLTCMASGISGDELERRVAAGDPSARQALQSTIEWYSGLAVFDRSLTPRVMRAAYDEACDHWGADADVVIVDYMDLFQGGDGVMAKADYLKAFGTDRRVPMIVLHQTSRYAGSKGQQMRIDSGSYGGETHATFQIGVWRRGAALRAELDELEARQQRSDWIVDRMQEIRTQLEVHKYTLTVNLNKNKRPSGQLVEGIDFEIDHTTGGLTPLYYGQLPEQYLRSRGMT